MEIYRSKEWKEAVGRGRKGVPSKNFRDKSLWKQRLAKAKLGDKNPGWCGRGSNPRLIVLCLQHSVYNH